MSEQVGRARERLNATPWWKPLKRQDAARDYRWALYHAAPVVARPAPQTEGDRDHETD